MLGDLPLITAQHFLNLGNEYWRERGFGGQDQLWAAPTTLQRLQRLLHHKGQEEDADDGEENNLIVESKYKVSSYSSWTRDFKIPFHEDILPRWEGTFYLVVLIIVYHCYYILTYLFFL